MGPMTIIHVFYKVKTVISTLFEQKYYMATNFLVSSTHMSNLVQLNVQIHMCIVSKQCY